jgi:hypothetical protein
MWRTDAKKAVDAMIGHIEMNRSNWASEQLTKMEVGV